MQGEQAVHVFNIIVSLKMRLEQKILIQLWQMLYHILYSSEKITNLLVPVKGASHYWSYTGPLWGPPCT